MIDLHIYAGLYNLTLLPLLAQLRGDIGNVVAFIRPYGLVGIGAYLAVLGIELGVEGKSIESIWRELFLAAMAIATLASAASYMDNVGDMFLNLPNSFAPAFGGQKTPMDGIDHTQNVALIAALKAYDALPDWSLKIVPLGLAVLAFIGVTFVCSGFSFLVFCAASGITVICVYIGPVFVALFAVPWTRRFAMGWLSVLVASVVTQVLCIAIIALTAGAEANTLTRTAAAISSKDNSIAMVIGLGQLGTLLALCTYLVYHLREIAHGIAGGVYHSLGLMRAATFGAAQGAVVAAATRVSNATSSAARGLRRPIAPTGQSASGSATP